MVIPSMSFKDAALHLISQNKKPVDVTEAVAKLKEHFASDEKYAAGLDERQLVESAGTIRALEKEMEESIRKNLSLIEKGLKITDEGKKRKSGGVPVDILCKDKKRNTVIVEISACAAGLEEIAAMVNCMGAVSAEDNVPVRGILIAREFSRAAVNSSKVIKDLELTEYKPEFKFERLTEQEST